MPKKKMKVAIVTGPTGGHFFPGLAIGEELERTYEVSPVFFVPQRKYLIVWLKKKGFEYHIIPEVRFSLKNVLFPLKFIYAFFRACLFIRGGRFDGVVITGSYATVPFLISAKLYGVKIFVHEQNYLPGKAIKFSALFADRIALTFPFFDGLPEKRCIVTGFPIISDFRQRYKPDELLLEFGFSPERTTVVVLGGSQGASFLNEMIKGNLEFLKEKKVQFLHLAGKDKGLLTAGYAEFGVPAKVYDFYFDMARLYSIADVVICRAGAGTLSEVNYWKIPAIVIPYPYAGGHQKYNALYFAEHQGCKMLEQNTETIKKFPLIFEETLKDLEGIKENLSKISIPDSDGKNVRQIMELLNEDRLS